MSWATGLIVILLFVIALWLIAEVADSGPSRAWIRRLQRLERGRAAQRSEPCE